MESECRTNVEGGMTVAEAGNDGTVGKVTALDMAPPGQIQRL